MSSSPNFHVIAERRYRAAAANEKERREIVVRIGEPHRDPRPGGDWACPYQVEGVGNDAVREIYGVDGLSAILLALPAIRAELTSFARRSGSTVTWLGSTDLGLPSVPQPD